MSSSSQAQPQPMQQDNKASIFEVATDTSAFRDPNLAPQRTTPGIRKGVKPPFADTSLSTFIYTISIAAAILTAFFAFRAMEWKSDNGMTIINLLLGKGAGTQDAVNPNPMAGAAAGAGADMDATVDM